MKRIARKTNWENILYLSLFSSGSVSGSAGHFFSIVNSYNPSSDPHHVIDMTSHNTFIEMLLATLSLISWYSYEENTFLTLVSESN